MARDELDLCIRKSTRGQEREHLMAEEVRVNVAANSRLPSVVLPDLLDTSRGESAIASGREEK